MSLRSFHIVFVTVCTLFSAFLVFWAFVLAPETSTAATAYGIAGVIGLCLLPAYAVYFIRKATKLHL
jgi:hypothetical protein